MVADLPSALENLKRPCLTSSRLTVVVSPLFLSRMVKVCAFSSLLTRSRSGLSRTTASAAVMAGLSANFWTFPLTHQAKTPKPAAAIRRITRQPMPTQASG